MTKRTTPLTGRSFAQMIAKFIHFAKRVVRINRNLDEKTVKCQSDFGNKAHL